jgi:hypothetical protein
MRGRARRASLARHPTKGREKMHRLTVPAALSALLVAMTVPVAGAFADDGSAPLKVHGKPSRDLELGFDLPDGWSDDDLAGPALNRGVYGRDLPAGGATCLIRVVTRGETTSTGIAYRRPLVTFPFDGGQVRFRALEQHGRWFRSSTSADTSVTPAGWKATGAAELDDAPPAVVLAQASAVAEQIQPDGTTRAASAGDRARCAATARGEIARGLRTILGSVTVQRR